MLHTRWLVVYPFIPLIERLKDANDVKKLRQRMQDTNSTADSHKPKHKAEEGVVDYDYSEADEARYVFAVGTAVHTCIYSCCNCVL